MLPVESFEGQVSAYPWHGKSSDITAERDEYYFGCKASWIALSSDLSPRAS